MPTSSPYFLGLDLGTSGCRGIVINQQADIVAQTRCVFDSSIDQHGYHQQSAANWWQAVVKVLEQLADQISLHAVVALSIDGTSGSVLLADANGEPLHDALMYNDRRAASEVQLLEQLKIENAAVLTPTSGLAKLLWLKQQAFSNPACYFLHQADWLNGRLLNRFGDTDINNALKSGFDPVIKQWPDYLEQLGINKAWLPRVHQPGEVLGQTDHTIAQQLGLNPQTRVIAGSTDSTAAIIATGVSKVGEAVTSLGSTMVLKIINDTPISNARYGVYSQPYGKHWLVGGASNSGGTVLKQFFSDEQLETLSHKLRPDNPTGLDYYPLPADGERFPINDPGKHAVMSPRPDKDTVFLQGLLEGMAHIEQLGYQRLNELGAPYPRHVVTCGGGAKNQAWNKIRQRYLNIPVSSARQQEAAYGMALLAKQAFYK